MFISLSFRNIVIFFFSGLGYIVGANVAHALNEWQWALRVTVFHNIYLTFVCMTLILSSDKAKKFPSMIYSLKKAKYEMN